MSIGKQTMIESIILDLGDATTSKIKKKLSSLIPKYPSFNDYLEAAMCSKNLSDDRKNLWREFFRVFSFFRTKVSHTEPK